jgi:hypothetical protein
VAGRQDPEARRSSTDVIQYDDLVGDFRHRSVGGRCRVAVVLGSVCTVLAERLVFAAETASKDK